MVHLALYKGREHEQIFGALIRAWTRSPYSHCEMALDGTGYSSSLMDGGVRAKKIDFNSGHWDLIPVPWINEFAVKDYYDATRHQTYGYMVLVLSQFLNRNYNSSRSVICSEWCAEVMGIPSPSMYSPARLAELVLYLNKIRK